MKLKRTVADALFSEYIRERADWKCEKCFREFPPPTDQLHASHFHSRSKKSVRFDFDNAAALCAKCHMYFDGNTPWGIQPHKQEHREWFLKRLGKERLDLLDFRASRPANSADIKEKYLREHLRERIAELKRNKPIIYGQQSHPKSKP